MASNHPLVALAVLVALAAIGHAAKISVSPTVVSSTPGTVNVSWEVDSATERHTIGLYLHVDGLSHLAAVNVPATLSGTISVPVVNLRNAFSFKLCLGDCSPATALVESETVRFQSFNEPQHPRLALTGKPSEMLLMFTTRDALLPPTVLLGPTAQSLSVVFNGSSTAPYKISDLCFSPANETSLFFDPGHQHSVLLTGLAPETTYFYQFGGRSDSEGLVWSAVHSFRTPPPSAASTASAVVFADMGVGLPYDTVSGGSSYPVARASVKWIGRLMQEPAWEGAPLPSLLVHMGDISYARGYPFVWEWFMTSVAPLASALPYMVGIGNHEYDYRGHGQISPAWAPWGVDSGGECGVPYSARFSMPAPPTAVAPPPTGRLNQRSLWYSYEQGPIHWTTMSTEHDFTRGSPQYKFLESDLAGVDRTRTPWVVFAGHRPMYTSEGNLTGAFTRTFLANVEPLFRTYHVDVALWGHIHKYERTCGILTAGTCADRDEDGTVHVVIGNAGNDYQTPWFETSPYHNPEPDWLVFRTYDFGISTLTANSTTLQFHAHGWKRGDIHDTFTLTKP
jgi:acid phosphatase type 7